MYPPNGPFYTTIDQTDAMVDMAYYIYDTCVKEGLYLDFKSHQVKFFSCPKNPPPPNNNLQPESKIFMHRMIVSELTELGESLHINPQDTIIQYKKHIQTNTEELAEAFRRFEGADDRFVVIMIVSLIRETCIAHRLPYEDFFQVVHLANIAKRNPATGEYNRRPDGKVIKPPGWKPPDLEESLRNFMLVHQLSF